MVKRRKVHTGLTELEALLPIDGDGLEVDVMRHPEIFYRVLKGLRDADLALKLDKDGLLDLEAVLAQEVREEHNNKITVDGVRNEVRKNQSWRDARDTVFVAEELYRKWNDLKEAFVQRSYSLRAMVDLYTTSYYANMEPKGQQGTLEDRAARSKTRKR
jgi:hypothetical protein